MCISRTIVKKLPAIVVVAALIPVVTILTTYTMSKTMGHLPKDTLFPQISLTGNHKPEYYVYATGFGVTGVLMVYLGFILHIKIVRCFLDGKGSGLNIAAMIFLFAAAVGLVTQGTVHLQEDFGGFDKETSHSSAPYSSSSSSFLPLIATDNNLLSAGKSYTVGTFVHLAGAGVFFVSALVYVILMDILLRLEDMRENGFHLLWWVAKFVLTVTYIGGAAVSVSGTYANADGPKKGMISAIGQWTAVFSFILYIATFAGDIYNVNNERLIQEGDVYHPSESFFDDNRPLMSNYD